MDIPFSGTLTDAHYYQAMTMYRHNGSKTGNITTNLFYFIVAIIFGVGVSQDYSRAIIIIPVMIIIALLSYLARKISSGIDQDVWSKSTNMHEFQKGVVNSQGIDANCPTCASQQMWTHFKYYLATDQMILLYVSPYLFNIYPKSFFNSELGWTTFAKYVQLYVPGEKPALWHSSLAPRLTFINTLYTLTLIVGIALVFSR